MHYQSLQTIHHNTQWMHWLMALHSKPATIISIIKRLVTANYQATDWLERPLWTSKYAIIIYEVAMPPFSAGTYRNECATTCSQNIVMFPWGSRNVPVMFLFSTWMNGQDQWKIAHHAAHQEGVVHCTLWKCPRWRGRAPGNNTSRFPLDLQAGKPIKLSKTYCTWVLFFTWFFPEIPVILVFLFSCFPVSLGLFYLVFCCLEAYG